MSLESFTHRALFSLKKIVKDKDIKVSTKFFSFLSSVSAEHHFYAMSPEDIAKPSILQEAVAFVHYSYFSGKIKEAFEGADIKNNSFMRELMIESSANLADWLALKHLLGNLDTYNLVVQTYLKRLAAEPSPFFSFDSLQEPPQDELGLKYLRNSKVPEKIQNYAYFIEEGMKHTKASEIFWRSRINGLSMAVNQDSLYYAEKNKVPIRREANVITHNVFRGSSLENMHAGSVEVTTQEIGQLENDAIHGMRDWLIFLNVLKTKYKSLYGAVITSYWAMYVREWEE